VTCPVTITRGAASRVLSAAGASAIVAPLANAFLEEFSGLDHFGPYTDPSSVAGALIRAADTSGA